MIPARDAPKKADTGDYGELHSTGLTDRVSSIALASLKIAKFKKQQLLPVTKDVQMLAGYLEN